jgi:putative flippase GtrA
MHRVFLGTTRRESSELRFIRGVYARFDVLIHEVAKFGVVGGIAFVITLGVTNALHSGAGVGPLTAVVIANLVATVFAFFGNRHWAFKHRQGKGLGRESVLFFVFNAIGTAIQLAVVGIVYYPLGLTDHLSYNIANVIGIGFGTLFRLFAYRKWVFLEHASPPEAEQLEPEPSAR